MAGLMLGGGYLLQTVGLAPTSAAVSGFITGMFVVLTSFVSALVLRQRVGPATWAAVALATVGLGFLRPAGVVARLRRGPHARGRARVRRPPGDARTVVGG